MTGIDFFDFGCADAFGKCTYIFFGGMRQMKASNDGMDFFFWVGR